MVNLSGGSPADAQPTAKWVLELGANFGDAAIMNNVDHMGQPGPRSVLAGDAAHQARIAPVMACLAQGIRYVSPNIHAAKATYQAFEMTYFGHLAATLHAADICLPEGITLTHPQALHGNDPVHQGFVQSLIDGDFRTNTITLESWAADLAMIRNQAAVAGIASPFPDLLAGFFDRAIAAGHGQDDAMAIWKALT